MLTDSKLQRSVDSLARFVGAVGGRIDLQIYGRTTNRATYGHNEGFKWRVLCTSRTGYVRGFLAALFLDVQIVLYSLYFTKTFNLNSGFRSQVLGVIVTYINHHTRSTPQRFSSPWPPFHLPWPPIPVNLPSGGQRNYNRSCIGQCHDGCVCVILETLHFTTNSTNSTNIDITLIYVTLEIVLCGIFCDFFYRNCKGCSMKMSHAMA